MNFTPEQQLRYDYAIKLFKKNADEINNEYDRKQEELRSKIEEMQKMADKALEHLRLIDQ